MISSFKTPGFSSSEMGSVKLWSLPEETGLKCEENSAPMIFEPDRRSTLTVESIEAMQKQAYEEAFALGKKDGFVQGFDEGVKKGFDEGLTEGLKKGYEENLHLLNEQATAFVRLMEALSEPFGLLDEEVEKELVRLAIAIAKQIIRREIRMDPRQIIAAVKESVKVLPLSSQKIYLHLHPEDAELVCSVMAPMELSPPWNVIEDPLITRGGCKVDTEISHIDASIENRLASVIATLFGGERQGDSSV